MLSAQVIEETLTELASASESPHETAAKYGLDSSDPDFRQLMEGVAWSFGSNDPVAIGIGLVLGYAVRAREQDAAFNAAIDAAFDGAAS